MQKPNPLERLILLSADEGGRVPFPQGHANDVAMKMRVLDAMREKGYLRRKKGEKFYRAFYLTPLGNRLKESLHSRELHEAAA